MTDALHNWRVRGSGPRALNPISPKAREAESQRPGPGSGPPRFALNGGLPGPRHRPRASLALLRTSVLRHPASVQLVPLSLPPPLSAPFLYSGAVGRRGLTFRTRRPTPALLRHLSPVQHPFPELRMRPPKALVCSHGNRSPANATAGPLPPHCLVLVSKQVLGPRSTSRAPQPASKGPALVPHNDNRNSQPSLNTY